MSEHVRKDNTSTAEKGVRLAVNFTFDLLTLKTIPSMVDALALDVRSLGTLGIKKRELSCRHQK